MVSGDMGQTHDIENNIALPSAVLLCQFYERTAFHAISTLTGRTGQIYQKHQKTRPFEKKKHKYTENP